MQQKYVINICFNMGQFQWGGGGHTYSKIIYASIFKSHVDIYIWHMSTEIIRMLTACRYKYLASLHINVATCICFAVRN